MLSRLRRVRLRPTTHDPAGRFRARRDQAHRRRNRAIPRATLLLPVVVAAGLVFALRPGDTTRATRPSTWAPLPATAFSKAAPASPGGARGGGDLTALPPDDLNRDGAILSASFIGRTSAARRPTTSARAPKGPTHVIASGDNLWTIARRHSADLASILRWNVGVDPDRLVAGQRILVPGGSRMAPLPRTRPESPRPAPGQRSAVRQASAPRTRVGSHVWPLAVRGTLTRRFSSAHPGIDIAASRGTRVRAIARGTVVWAGWKNNGGGYVVEIAHQDGMRSIYNHNSRVAVQKGDPVAQGDTIAFVGSTGWSTGPHLDLRIRMNGRLVDPLDVY